jgi:hypothetical protein
VEPQEDGSYPESEQAALDADNIETLTRDRVAMDRILAQLKQEDRLDAAAIKQVEALLANRQELMSHWKAFEEERAKKIDSTIVIS